MLRPHLSVLSTTLAALLASNAYAAAAEHPAQLDFGARSAASPALILAANAQRYQLPAASENLKLSQVQTSLLGRHTHYQQSLFGLPIADAEIIVSQAHDGRLLHIFNSILPISAELSNMAQEQLKNSKRLSPEQALDQAWNTMKVQHPLTDIPRAELVWLGDKTGLHLAYKVDIAAQMPTGGFIQYLDANTGEKLRSSATTLPRIGGQMRPLEDRGNITGPLLNRHEETQHIMQSLAARPVIMTASGIDGSGNVFDPDPHTTLNSDSLTDTSAASAFDAAYFVKPLHDLTVNGGVYSLNGPYVAIANIEAPSTAPSTTSNGIWTAKRGDNAFNDANTYFHIDQNQRYMQSLGFTGASGIIEKTIRVDTDGENGADNSHYSPGSPGNLVFGHGCVDDDEDADVILHEYGHGIQHNIDNNWGGADTGAMGEGFGDYWGGSYSYGTPNGAIFHPEWIFSWDGHNDCWPGRDMNRTDAMYNPNKTYGAHQSVTENGVTFQSDELWSTPLLQSLISLIAQGKPHANVDKIILEAHFGLGANITMPMMATAIVNTAKALFPNDAAYATTFNQKFAAQKILALDIPETKIKETEPNNGFAKANIIANSNTTVSAHMSTAIDKDMFAVTLPAGNTLTVTLTPNASSNYDIDLLSDKGKLLASSSNGSGLVDTITRKSFVSTDKVFYVRVKYISGGLGWANGAYSLNLKWQ